VPEENVEIIRLATESFNRSGLASEETLGYMHPDLVFEEPPEQPAPRVAEGRDAAVKMFQEFDSAWQEHRSEPEEIRALDHERVLVLSIEHFRGRDGIEIQQPSGAIYTLREGKIIRMQSFWERETAFRVAGVAQ
jgi:ketosteroid isomerase-like protein